MVLLTGGLGYLGVRITKHLYSNGIPVRIGSSRVKPTLPNLLNGCEIAHMNLLDSDSMD